MDSSTHTGIIGAGFAGLVAALRLKKQGDDDFVIFERADEIGGTWRDNVYPGCACDIEAPLYSFADEPNPNWSHSYAGQPEILAYVREVVERHDLRQHIRFGSDIVGADFDAAGGSWTVRTADGAETRVRALLLGLGPLNRVHVPAFEGLADFAGKTFHTAEWDPTYSLAGKRVAVIGTGASAIQVIPSIAPEVGALHVFQRTPAWVQDRGDQVFSEGAKARFRRMPWLQRLLREAYYWWHEFTGLGFIGYRPVNRLMKAAALHKLRKEVEDPALRQQLTPDYTIGCKRILRSDDFYPTFNQDHVHLITAGIERFEAQGIRTADGTLHELDAVIFATGFRVSDFDFPITITGLNGASLFEQLSANGGQVFKGMTVPGFPNLAFILGPNTGLGHNTVVHMMESQMTYLSQYLTYLRELPAGASLDLKPEVLRRYMAQLQAQFEGTVWQSGCQSWYLNQHGQNTTLYPRLNTRFRKITRHFTPQQYEIRRGKSEQIALSLAAH